jgi:hypothetical protein
MYTGKYFIVSTAYVVQYERRNYAAVHSVRLNRLAAGSNQKTSIIIIIFYFYFHSYTATQPMRTGHMGGGLRQSRQSERIKQELTLTVQTTRTN